MSNVNAILFDFSQTLVDSVDGFRAAEKRAQGKLFAALRGPSHEEFLHEYRSRRKRFQHEGVSFPRPNLWREVLAAFGSAVSEETLSAWEVDYWTAVRDHTRLLPETLHVLGQLKARCPLGLVTNRQGPGGGECHGLDRFPALAAMFSAIVIAGEGLLPPKPAPEPFLACLSQLGISPGHALYVGDDWDVDILGARSAGLTPIWLKHHLVHRHWPAGDAQTPIIDRLDPLLSPPLLPP